MEPEQLVRVGRDREASGDLQAAFAAYSEADRLGDPEASVLLGELHRRQGDVEQARAALSRAESRGHMEAAMCLGNLHADLSETREAEAAYARAVSAGSQVAVLNLGLLLADQGRDDEALELLRRSAADGDSTAAWAVGRLLEKRGDFMEAADAYRRGADAGDAQAAFGLGAVLMKMGQKLAARGAFQRALDLGYESAKPLLEWFAKGETEAEFMADGESRAGDPAAAVAAVRALEQTLARIRYRMRQSWATTSFTMREKSARQRALEDGLSRWRASHERVRAEIRSLQDQFGSWPERPFASSPTDARMPSYRPAEWLQSGAGAGEWRLSSEETRAFEAEMREAETALAEIRKRVFTGSYRRVALGALARIAQRIELLVRVEANARVEAEEAGRSRVDSATMLSRSGEDQLVQARQTADAATRTLPALMQPWSNPQWGNWIPKPSGARQHQRLAFGGSLVAASDPDLGSNANFGAGVRVPWFMPLHINWSVSHSRGSRATAHGFVRSLMLRHLASEHPGDVRLCVFDPVGLGQSVGDVLNLAEYDPDLISGKVWSSAQDLDGRLAELAAHIELVIQKYLRTAYETIDDFNADAGEVAEPYRVLVLFDFPTSLSEESASRLKSILQNGPRCGVFTIMALEETANAQYGVGVSALTNATRRLALESGFQAEVDGYKLRYSFEPEVLPEANSVAQQVIEAIGREAATRTATAVSVDKTFGLFNAVATRGLRAELPAAATRTRFHDPSTWWQNDTVRGISAPIGQKGAREAAILTFDSGDHAGGLLVGRPGSGKTTLLHSYIAGLTTLYSPEELSLYLIDFKEGVEFKVYAEEGLPHARVVAVESDREFGLSVLESVQLEISRRGELLRGTGGRQASMQALRQATGQTMPRILLIFDEFQVLFARNDKLGLSAADLLESIIRQGRGFGVHVLLGSQSLAGMDALGSHVHQLLPVKILLPASEQDAHKVLGDTNNAGSYLATAGEGILNAAGGAIESNERFKGSILTEMDRVVRLQVMREKADTLGFMTRPMVFEGSKAAPLDTVSPASFREELAATGWAPLRIRAGRPMAVGQLGDLTLTRDAGANVLAIMRSTDTQIGGESSGALALGLVAISVASVATSSANIDIIDFLSNDDGLDAALEPFLETQRITLRRRRAFRDTLERYAAELSDRIERDDTRAGARVLFLVGIHRARELDADSGSLDADEDLAEMLTQVMRDGPEFGIHVWMWAESLSAVARRLTSDMMREIGWRIAGRMSGEDSDRLIGNRLASELRDNQLVLTNDDFGISTRVIAYQPPSRIWLTELANLTPHNNGDSHA